MKSSPISSRKTYQSPAFCSLENEHKATSPFKSTDIPKDLKSPEQIALYNTLKSPNNRLGRVFTDSEAYYFAKKLSKRREIIKYYEDITTKPEVRAIYDKIKDKDFTITTSQLQTSPTDRELTFKVKENDTYTKYIFINGELVNCSRSYNVSSPDRTNFDHFKRTTTLYSLGEIVQYGQTRNFVKTIIQILNDEKGQPNRIIKTHTNAFDNSVNTQTFYLNDYDEDFDVLSAVKKGTIKPRYETTTHSYDKKTNSITTKENYNNSGITTTKTTIKTPNGWQVSFKIKDEKGNVLYTTNKSHKKLDKNTSLTTLNGKNFIAKFDENGNVTINNQRYGPYIQGYELNAVLEEFLDISFEEDEEFYDYTKSHLPVDLIILIKSFHAELEYANNPLEAANKGYSGGLKVPKNIGIIAHELGHTINTLTPRGAKYLPPIEDNKELMEVYKEELKAFENSHSQIVHDLTISYFGKTGGSNKKDELSKAGLSELIAETMTIISTPSLNHKAVVTRTHYLMMHFPKTIALIANLIDEKCTSCFESFNQ